MDFTGKVIAVLQPKSGTSKANGSEWKAQEYVLESHEQYPKRMCFEVFGAEKIDQFNIQAGEELTVSFDIDARQWQDRWFNRIRAWKVERVAATGGASFAPSSYRSAPTPPPLPTASPDFTQSDANDDLPF
jgi:hypothetical protein